MEFIWLCGIFVVLLATLCLLLLLILTFSWWIFPIQIHKKLKRNGFGGPTPSFPFGNIEEMKRKNSIKSCVASSNLTNDIHSQVFPYFSSWQKSFGKVFIYWLGTEPFLYIANAEFLKKMSTEVMAKRWGKPSVFRNDRDPMFGSGLVMVEGNDWVRHRHIVAPAFNPLNLKVMASMMIESTNQMIDRWTSQINFGNHEIDMEKEIITIAGEIIAKTSFGAEDENAKEVFDKLRALQMTLFNTNRYVGVPFGKYFNVKKNLEAKKLGKEIDKLLLSIVEARKNSPKQNSQKDLLGLLLKENNEDGKLGKTLTSREVVDECKTFFFGGHETTALAITWTLLLLATHEDWQNQLREEIKEVVGNNELDITMLSGLKKMKCVMNEVLRLYPPAPNVQRQAREDIQVDDVTVPNGTNMWIDVVAMHHDPELWGDDVNEFKPERFMDDVNGGCKHKMGYLPFGFGGRMCVGRNLTFMEYKIVLTILLSNFTFKVSPSYQHSPAIMLSLRPAHGLPLIVQPLN
ncbi:putative cytochrome P450 [Medicago truncatula]|uniref:Cytochrome P450 family 72 protein n=1 Tax=Medicago truncatula TaxID=3880 RepID=G7IAM5_MEDTR|nr:cytokinin hydroxylase [Medicago truncatula]AES62528.1 cytochrome P450 family 72 protein [Medicago truncatula]RHN81809.1 putative cytochrome P450 [Medicago truncatula]